jgi:phosphoenolpyruvate-protein kinase (PTS system EI component)
MINGNAREVRVPIVIRGTGIGRGVAIGPLRFGSLRGESIRRRTVREVEKLKAASDAVKEELSVMEARAVKSVGDEHGEIYRMLRSELEGGEFLDAVQVFIENGEELSNACDEAARSLAELAKVSDDRNKKALAARSRELSELLKNAAECTPENISAYEPDTT